MMEDRKADGPLIVRARRCHQCCPFGPWDFGTSRWQLKMEPYIKFSRIRKTVAFVR